jgi:RNA 2',3'-cyclic 3'-phosphodiesterase
VRVFAAFELPQPVRSGIEKAFSRARSLAPKVKWVSPDAMHLTLHFFGEVAEAEIDGFSPLFEDPTLSLPSIRAQLGSVGFFPAGGPPRVLWVGLAKGVEEMRAFWSRFTEGVQKLREGSGPLREWSPDTRGFSPHITVARAGAAPLSRLWADEVELPPTEFVIEHCVLFQSILGPSGARYIPLKTLALAGGAA